MRDCFISWNLYLYVIAELAHNRRSVNHVHCWARTSHIHTTRQFTHHWDHFRGSPHYTIYDYKLSYTCVNFYIICLLTTSQVHLTIYCSRSWYKFFVHNLILLVIISNGLESIRFLRVTYDFLIDNTSLVYRNKIIY